MTGIINFSLSSKISPVSFAQFEPSAPAQTDIFKLLVFSSISSHLHVMYQHTQGASQSTPINIPRPSQNSCKQPIKLQNGLNGPYVSPWGGANAPMDPLTLGKFKFFIISTNNTNKHCIWEFLHVFLNSSIKCVTVVPNKHLNQSQPSDCSWKSKSLTKLTNNSNHVFCNLCCRLMASWPPFSACPV